MCANLNTELRLSIQCWAFIRDLLDESSKFRLYPGAWVVATIDGCINTLYPPKKCKIIHEQMFVLSSGISLNRVSV